MSLIDKDKYESIVFSHDFQKKHLEKALHIVKKYIIEHKLILVGGMAIDLAVRQKGDQLYPDDKLPDYDFLSPTFHKDSYRLGEQLAQADIPGISCIRGLHASTMRTRVNFVPVADITYVPENVFHMIPTILVDQVRIIHPHYQMIDQHRALSLPYENPPFETIMQRWDKDMKRYDLLSKHYPIGVDSTTREQEYTMEKRTLTVDLQMLEGHCLGGYPALLYWLAYAKQLGYNYGKLDVPELKEFKSNSIKIDIDPLLHVSILTNNYEALKLKDGIWYNALLDKIPKRLILDDYEILYYKSSLVSAHQVGKYHIVGLQNIMCHMLTMGIMYDNKAALHTYQIARKLLLWACQTYIKDSNKELLVLLPSIEVYGKDNYNESYELALKDFKQNLRQAVKNGSHAETPKNAYPEKNKPVKEDLYAFDPTKSPIYQVDGLEIKNIKEMEG
jgi:hypothetical protein